MGLNFPINIYPFVFNVILVTQHAQIVQTKQLFNNIHQAQGAQKKKWL